MEKRYHVLIVEDDPFIRKVLLHTLKADFDVTMQNNGIEAMSWLDQGNQVDVVVTDLQMPHMNGLELIQLIRASSFLQTVPVIVLSSYSDSNTRVSCLEQGADDYITKPFNPMELKAKLLACMRRVAATEITLPLSSDHATEKISSRLAS